MSETAVAGSSATGPDPLLAARRVLATACCGAEPTALLEHAWQIGGAVSADAAARVAVAALVAETLVADALRLEPVAAQRGIVERVAEAAGVDAQTLAIDVAARVLNDVRLLCLPPRAALEGVLSLLLVLAPVEHVSLWRARADGSPECMVYAGAATPTHVVRDLAARYFDGATSGLSRTGLFQVAGVAGTEGYAVVARPRTGEGARALPLVRYAGPVLRAALTEVARIERDAATTELQAAAAERRVARIGSDLRDGPIQTVAALLADTGLLSTHMRDRDADDDCNERVLEGLDDLKTMMVALEFEMRSLCESLESPVVIRRPFKRVVEQEIASFQRATGILPRVELCGPFENLSPSQRIALLRVLQEALRNVREHSSATSVSVRITTAAVGTAAAIRDDGGGFDVDAALARAVRDGRVGLLGIMERIRMLGGTCEVRSTPGGPTVVAALLPRWDGQRSVATSACR